MPKKKTHQGGAKITWIQVSNPQQALDFGESFGFDFVWVGLTWLCRDQNNGFPMR